MPMLRRHADAAIAAFIDAYRVYAFAITLELIRHFDYS